MTSERITKKEKEKNSHSSSHDLNRDKSLASHQLENLNIFIKSQQGNKQLDPIIHNIQKRVLQENLIQNTVVNTKTAQSLLSWINSIKVAVENNTLPVENATLLLSGLTKITTEDGVSILQRYYMNENLKIIDSLTGKESFGSDSKKTMIYSNKKALENNIKIRYKANGAVDKRCKAYKQGLVDEAGRLIVPLKSEIMLSKVAPQQNQVDSSDKMVILTQYSGIGRPRKTP